MARNYLFLCLFGISVYCPAGIVAREAIVGGYIATPADCQYQATILITDHAPRCGGGIIRENVVLTAAHCVIAADEKLIGQPISALVATHDLSVKGVIAKVVKIIIPQEYNPQISYPIGDIAVLKLKYPLEMEKHALKQLFLPKYADNTLYDYKKAYIAGIGWDKVFENNELIGEHTDHKIRIVDAEVLSNIQCKKYYATLNITEQYLCARVFHHNELRHGTCIGDGGGPLVLKGKTAIGILSVTTVGCSEKQRPAIYTRVSFYRDFIHAAINDVKTSNMRKFYV